LQILPTVNTFDALLGGILMADSSGNMQPVELLRFVDLRIPCTQKRHCGTVDMRAGCIPQWTHIRNISI
jgi:hypothetical protein